ncbi:MAG: NAD-dependent epimerase/dehydratase family protein [Candidatus Wallbacteria bacterium]|nr:NAD-dependent epimerase/dehydratase family protein [Candidatus Wallbacteria bacterium]
MDLADKFRGTRCLITGGLGFIGSHLAARLAGFGAWVTVVDSLIEGYGGNLFNVEAIKDRIRINISDVRDQSSTNWLVRNQDYLFNLAGTLSHIDSMTDPFTDLEINCRSQLSILESCRKFNPTVKVVFSGTRGEYGRAQYLPVDEKHPLCPTDTNGINNMAGELYHILYNNVYGIRAVSLRLTNVFGPHHQMRHSRQGYLNWFVRLAIDDQEVPIYGEGEQLRDFNYVDDVVEALLVAGAEPATDGEIYNLGSGKPVSVGDSARAVLEAAGTGRLKQIAFPEEKKKIEIGDYYADFSKFTRATGWQPKVEFADGLRRTVHFYRKHKEHYW